MIRCIILLLVWMLFFICQSVESDGSSNGPPTFNCNYGFEGYSTDIVPPKRRNMSQGRPGKKGIKGDQGLRGLKGIKGEPGQSDDTREAIENLTKAQNLINQKLQNLTIQVQALHVQKKDYADYSNSGAEDCSDLKKLGVIFSGVYNITINRRRVEVFCDMETDGGGWTVIQRRTSNAVDFFRDWLAFQNGFGSIPSNFWLGLDNIHAITKTGSYKLRVDLMDFSNQQAYALYSSFSIGSKYFNYRLHVSGYSGNAGDSLKNHNNHFFSTKDRDNDACSCNCAVGRHGAWWYKSCAYSNLNGKYYSSAVNHGNSVNWYHWKSKDQSLKRVEMKIKPN